MSIGLNNLVLAAVDIARVPVEVHHLGHDEIRRPHHDEGMTVPVDRVPLHPEIEARLLCEGRVLPRPCLDAEVPARERNRAGLCLVKQNVYVSFFTCFQWAMSS